MKIFVLFVTMFFWLLNVNVLSIESDRSLLEKLLNKLDNPHRKLPPIIHIAGTNGKGSTLSYLRNILMQHNKKIHAYISPHLRYFNEKIF